jgi:hypothetical protein
MNIMVAFLVTPICIWEKGMSIRIQTFRLLPLPMYFTTSMIVTNLWFSNSKM